MGRFVIKHAKAEGKLFFTLKAGNGEPIGKSEIYNSMEACKAGIESVRKNAGAHIEDQTMDGHPNYPHPKYEIFLGQDKQFYFRLKAKNGEPILASEGYTAKESCNKGILSVGKNAPDAPVEIEDK